ncbi:mitochondrial ribosomal subunit S27-domain-containing protein [Hysterangium stoloniferum]|nr:mitochondrial ribosomal subunit S27-domain-containing protein [Hysterangium stoloniferum]
MPAVMPSRLAALTRLRCSIFATAYNPTSQRTGAKYLRARLRGPSMVNYYPTSIRIHDINKAFPELALEDEDEIQRISDIEALRERGKGAPKKVRKKEESRRLAKKR